MKEIPGKVPEGRAVVTRNAIIREYFRLCDLVNEAEQADLLDAADAQGMRDRYHDRAEAVLSYYRREESRGAPLTAL